MENKKMFVTKIDLDKFFSELADELKEEKINTLFSSLKSLLNNIKEVAEKQIENEKKVEDGTPIFPNHKLYYIKNLALKRGWSVSQMVDFLRELWDFYPAAALSLLMREIAVELDKNYKDHINDSDKIFVISVLDGKIHKVAKNHIKNYRNFAAFRTLEDARIACKTLQKELRFMFHNGKQENKKC